MGGCAGAALLRAACDDVTSDVKWPSCGSCPNIRFGNESTNARDVSLAPSCAGVTSLRRGLAGLADAFAGLTPDGGKLKPGGGRTTAAALRDAESASLRDAGERRPLGEPVRPGEVRSLAEAVAEGESCSRDTRRRNW